MATDILESAPWSMVKMVILWLDFVVKLKVYHFHHGKFVFCWMVQKLQSNTLIPKNLCAIILSTIYLSPKNLGIKFELIWATENLGTNSSKDERFSTEPSVVYLPQIIIFSYYFSNLYVELYACRWQSQLSNIMNFPSNY